MKDNGEPIVFKIVKDKKGRLILITPVEDIEDIPEENEYGIYAEPFVIPVEFKEFLKTELINRGAVIRNDQQETIYLECNPQDLIRG